MSFNITSDLKSSKQFVVSTTNGTKASVTGEGSFFVDKLNLDYVLIVLSLNLNLIYIS